MKHLVTVRIESPAFDTDAVRIIEITGTETISRLFEMTLRLAAVEPGAFDEEKLLTSVVELVFERTDEKSQVVTEERRIGGVISTVRDRFLTESEHREVIATFVPRAWLTTLTQTTDIFQDMTIPEIVQKKLETGAGLAGADVEMRLEQTYPKREFVVQYKESDHDFISRLTEDLGIHFFFERKKDKDVLVFADDNGAFKPSTPESAPFMRRGESANIFELEATRKVVPRVFKARDYNYRNPALDLLGEVDSPTMGANGYVDEFGPHAKTSDEAKFYASIRAQEANSRHLVFEGTSDLPGLRAGSIVAIEGHPRGEMKLVVVEVRHEGRQAVFGAEGDAGYRNTFKAIPEAITFRPARITPKPVVHGVVTGIVQSEASTNFGAVDAEGRYRVSFMYDTVTDRGEGKASRPLRMAQPSAGADRGFHQPLKVGTEVIITCLNGDPDRPIISGAVPNPQTPSPVTSANAEKSMWKTNVNQIAIDDNEPRMKLTVDGDKHLFQVGEPNGPEQGFHVATVANWTATISGVSSQVASTASAIQSTWTAWTGQNVTSTAGVPDGSWFDSIEAAVTAAVGWAKTVNSLAHEHSYKAAKSGAVDGRTDAEKTLKAQKKKLASTVDATPKMKSNDDGTVRAETEDEALDRAFKERREAHEKVAVAQKELEAAKATKDPAVEAAAATKLDAAKKDAVGSANIEPQPKPLADDAIGPAPMETPAEALDRVLAAKKKEDDTTAGELQKAAEGVQTAKDGEKKIDDGWAESGWNPETGDFGAVTKIVESAVAAAGAINKAKKLWSFISKLKGEAISKGAAASIAGLQKASGILQGASGQRHRASVGTFTPFWNLQSATNSVGIHGLINTVVVGNRHLDLYSPASTTVCGGKELHLKSRLMTEVAATDVFVSAKNLVDVDSLGQMKLTSKDNMSFETKDAGKDIKMMSKHGFWFGAEEDKFQVQAKRSIAFCSNEEHITLITNKQNINLHAKADVDVKTADGKIKVAAKQTLDLVSDATMSLHAKQDVNVFGKNLKLDASGDFHVKAKSLTLNGSKIHLK